MHLHPRRSILTMPTAKDRNKSQSEVTKIVPFDFSDQTEPNDIELAAEDWFATIVGARSFEFDLEQARPPEKDTLYLRWADKLIYSLGAAYPLYLHLLNDPTNVSKILNDDFFKAAGSKARKPSTKNLALLALKFVTRPMTEEDNKSCSAYSNMLKLAYSRKVNPETFPEEMKSVTLREARQFFRKFRSKAAGKKIKVEFFTGEGSIRKEISLPASTNIDEEFCERVKAELSAYLV